MKKILLLITIVTLLISCSNFMYYPSVANTPLLQSKDEIQISAGLKGYSGYLTAAYGLTDHFALQGGGNLLYLDVTELGEDYKIGNLNAELAAGFYFPFAKKIVAEIYFGGGLGTSSANHINTSTLTTRNFGKLYFQGDIGFKGRHLKAGIAIKEVLVNVYREKTDGVDTGLSYWDMFFEPFLFLSIGGEKHKVTIQAGLSDSQFNVIDYAPFIVALGYEYQFLLSK